MKKVNRGKEVIFVHKEEIAAKLLNLIKPGDLVLTLGAGDIVKVNDELVEALKRQG